MDPDDVKPSIKQTLSKTADLLKSLTTDLKDTAVRIPNLERNVASCESQAASAGYALWL